jgi:hypothetical protein
VVGVTNVLILDILIISVMMTKLPFIMVYKRINKMFIDTCGVIYEVRSWARSVGVVTRP